MARGPAGERHHGAPSGRPRARHAPGAAAVLDARNVVFRGLVERSGAEIEFMGAHFDGMPEVFDELWKEARLT